MKVNFNVRAGLVSGGAQGEGGGADAQRGHPGRGDEARPARVGGRAAAAHRARHPRPPAQPPAERHPAAPRAQGEPHHHVQVGGVAGG
eukprot:1195994-Prorocentrum_minimum.AAC.4